MAGALTRMFPGWAAKRARSRLVALQTERALARLEKRWFEGASGGRRNEGWRSTGSGANSELAPALARLRNRARDLRRNNPYAESGITGIADHAVGHGIVPNPIGRTKTMNKRVRESWKAWAETTACDADGLHNVYGIQHQAMETIAESGEILIRRRRRFTSDGLPVPLQLQLLEPDYLDETKDGDLLTNSGRIIQGVEFDAIGRRVAYWLFDQHPGESGWHSMISRRVPAEDVLHVFLQKRPGQARGYTFLAPIMQRMRNFDEMEDAVIEQAKIAACFAAFVHSDSIDEAVAGKAPPLIDRIEPAIIERLGPNEQVTFGSPPTFSGYQAYSWQALHAIAVGLGIPYELLVGDLKGVNFSSGRMGWLRFHRRLDVWQWRMLIPMLCDGIWKWFLEAQSLLPGGVTEDVPVEWVPPRKTMLDPQTEITATKDGIRNGLLTWSDAVRELGYSDPASMARAMADDNALFDELGLVLDCDPRKVGAVGAGWSEDTSGDDTSASNDDDEQAGNGDDNEENEDNDQ